MANVLSIDFGSTYTKGVLLDLSKETIISQGIVNTSQTNLLASYHKLTNKLAKKMHVPHLDISKTLICSSAFGGFKMVAIGLTDSLTTAAAKKVALGAGTRILKTYSYHLSLSDIQEINQLQPDVILLTGGTDGGNTSFILNSAQKLATLAGDIPIIVAGNQQTTAQIKNLLSERTYYLSDNVLPKVNTLQATATRNCLRHIFFEKIIYAKGFEEIAKISDSPIIPTPTAVLNGAKLLAEGSGTIQGLGSLAIIDIGGATTDIHSASDSLALQDVLYEGLPEPFLKRTVEGDLGMRSSAVSLLETAGLSHFQHYDHHYQESDIWRLCAAREQDPEFIPDSKVEADFDLLMAKIAGNMAMERHAGTLRRERHSDHDTYYQQGKDLRHLDLLIGTGGVIVNSSQPKAILTAALQTDTQHLKPTNPELYLDHSYLLSALGHLGEEHPQIALRLLKKHLSHL